jgi:hypothetical protein
MKFDLDVISMSRDEQEKSITNVMSTVCPSFTHDVSI